MPGLLGSLINNFQALNANSTALDITGKNLANINNAGYARQRVLLGSLGNVDGAIGTQSMGVMAVGLQQARDVLIDRQLQRDITLSSALATRYSGLQATEAAIGQQLSRLDDTGAIGTGGTSTGSGINENLSTLFAGFESWSINPAVPGEKQLLLQKAEILVDKFNTSDSRLAQVQVDLTAQVKADITKVNDLLKTISTLNNSIASAENIKPDSAVDMRDQRQANIEELSKYMDVQVQEITGSHGQVSLMAKDGANNAVPLINPTLTGPVTFDGTNFSAGAPPTQLALTGGSLQAGITLRDGMVVTMRTDLKKLADQITASVNKAYNPNNDPGKNFFSAAPTSGLMQVEATTSTLRATLTGTAGGNELAVAVAGLSSTVFSTAAGDQITGSFSSFFSGMVANLGLDLSNTTKQLEDQKLSEASTRENRDSVSGVSQDEEMGDLLRFQRSYQACARFTNAIDGLLDLVVNRLGNF